MTRKIGSLGKLNKCLALFGMLFLFGAPNRGEDKPKKEELSVAAETTRLNSIVSSVLVRKSNCQEPLHGDKSNEEPFSSLNCNSNENIFHVFETWNTDLEILISKASTPQEKQRLETRLENQKTIISIIKGNNKEARVKDLEAESAQFPKLKSIYDARIRAAKKKAYDAVTFYLCDQKHHIICAGVYKLEENKFYLEALLAQPTDTSKGYGKACLMHAMKETVRNNKDLLLLGSLNEAVDFYKKYGLTSQAWEGTMTISRDQIEEQFSKNCSSAAAASSSSSSSASSSSSSSGAATGISDSAPGGEEHKN